MTATAAMRTVRYLDLRVDDDERRKLLDAVDRVLRHGRILLGPEVDELETQLAQRCGTRHAIGVSSGTASLYFALKALGIGAGDEVITTAMSFIATANAIAAVGATPVFVDIGNDLNIDPARVEAAITPRTRAILPVHYTGRVCDMDRLAAIAAAHNLHLIEDASQAFGASWRSRPVGSIGRVGCISLNPMKILSACGEAGVVVTDDDVLRERLVALRYNGLVDRENCKWVSLNGRIDTIQAAMLLVRLARVDEVIARRAAIMRRYRASIGDVVRVPDERTHAVDVYYTCTSQSTRRDALLAHLGARGIEAKVYHPRLMPDHDAYRSAPRGDLSNARRLAGEILCLPVHEKLTDDEVDYVIDAVRSFDGVGR